MHLNQTLQAKNSYFCKLSYKHLFYNAFLTKNPKKTITAIVPRNENDLEWMLYGQKFRR
ncbi:hypothetical protein Za10_1275 [Zymomonas mobilis subsp. mobilis NCIMB 11163]|nr:hypothetical protein Za10_1275 [Zymomonas mobilis subsp. mobilis NCIMB 11163]